MGNPPESVDDLENNDYTSDNDLHEDNEEQTEHFKHENAGRSISDNVDEIINLDISGSYESESGKPLYNDMHEVNEDQTENGYAGRSISDIVDEIINLGNPGKYDLGSGKQCTSVRYVRQVIKLNMVCNYTPANMKVFVIPVNTAGIRQQDRTILRHIKKQSMKV